MPIYGYACKECAHTLDALQKLSDDPLLDCPECGKPALKRQLSAPRFRLKGKGWYETDFKNDKQRNLAGEAEPAKADGKDAAADAGKADLKPEPKPDAKPDAKPDTAVAAKPAKEPKTEKAKPKPETGDKSGAA
jgi:putative FmdB family regulatory protein